MGWMGIRESQNNSYGFEFKLDFKLDYTASGLFFYSIFFKGFPEELSVL